MGQARPVQQSWNGWHLSPHGTIRILLLFVEVEYDVTPGKDPQPDGAAHWPKGQLPVWKDNVFDPRPLPVQQAMVSRYYQDISLGNFTVLGDYLDGLIHLRESEYPGVHNAHGIGTLAVQEANKRGTLRTRHGSSIADLDLWKDGGKPGLPKEAGPDVPHSYDHVMVITRNSGLRHGTGSTDSGSPGKLFGHGADTQSRFGGNNDLPFEILKHEFNHLLIGGNNFHSGGGNASQFESTFINLQGGWSMMGAGSSSLLTCSGWDRDRMGWKPEGAVERIRALRPEGGEVNSDLDPLRGDTGLFLLRDLVTSGDALRVRMPFIPEDQLQQWIWVENHQGYHHNGSPTDRFLWESQDPCKSPVEPGLFMTMQVGREQREGTDIYGGIADYLRPIPANGLFDIPLPLDTVMNTCPVGGRSLAHVLDPDAANPLSGNHEQELPVHDRNGDGQLQRGEHWVPGTRRERGKPDAYLVFSGRPEHALRMGGVQRIDMCTNPSTANMMTLVSTGNRDVHKRKGPNVRTVYLNGISIELVEMRPNGDALVHIRTDGTRLRTDQRWCADSIVLPALRGADGHSLSIAPGRRLLLDRSRTATRIDAPDTGRGGPWFSDPTRLTVRTGASINVEDGAAIELVGGSNMHLLSGSKLAFGRKAQLKVDPSARVVVHSGALLTGKQRMLRKLRKKGRLVDGLDQ